MPMCCVPGCRAHKKKCRGLNFHTFPKDIAQRKSWIVNIRRDESPNFKIQPWTAVCSRHFTKSCFTQRHNDNPAARRNLLKGSVPTLFEWNDWGESMPLSESPKKCYPLLQNKMSWEKLHSSTMEEKEPNFTEKLRKVIKEEYQEIDEAIYCTQFSEKQNKETNNAVHEKPFQKCVMNSERESSSCSEEQSSTSELWRVIEERIAAEIDNIFHKSDQVCEMNPSDLSTWKKPHAVHSSEKPFLCQICQSGFPCSSTLTFHQVVHTGEKPLKCQICQKGFVKSSALKQHQDVHTSNKTFKCQMCQRGFSQSSHLRQHQVVHTSEKPFVCQICQKGFSHSSSLSKHQVVHTGIQIFKCQICHEEFTLRRALMLHLPIHTGDKLYKCLMCQNYFCEWKSLKYHLKLHID